MEEIRLLNSDEIRNYIEIAANAFPILNIKSDEDIERHCRRILRSAETGFSAGAYGCFRDGSLAGGMQLYDLTMSVFGQPTLFGGLGFVAVDLLRKKEKIAKSMVSYFLEHYDAKGAFLVGLYAFRPDFYKKMGFGFGPKAKQYRLSPAMLPKGSTKTAVRLLKKDEKHLLLEYNGASMMKRHGCVRFSEFDVERFFETGDKLAGVMRDGRLTGYLRFSIEQAQLNKYVLHVSDFVYDDREAFAQLICFLNSQADQFEKVLIDTGDEYFHHLCDNPSNGESHIFLHHQTNVEELGIMYRVINVRRFFENLKDHNFGGVTTCVRFNIADSFYNKNNGSVTVSFKNGRASPVDAPHQFEVDMDISEFSSMALGIVPFSSLYLYSRAKISDEKHLNVMDRLFYTGEKPICHVRF